MLRISRMRQVLAIHDLGSFAKAAERLGVAQSSLSKSIARLEDELQVKLLERTTRGSRLTPAGEFLAERARGLVEETERLQADLKLVAGGHPSELRIGCASALGEAFLSDFALIAARASPEVGLHFEISPSDRLLQSLERRRLDLVFAGRPPGAELPGFDVIDVLSAATVVVAAPDHPLARMNEVTLADLHEHRLCGLSAAHAKALGIGHLASRYHSNSFGALLPLVAAGLAVMIAPSFVVKAALQSGQLVALPCDWSTELTYSAITNRGIARTAAIKALIEIAAQCAAAV